MTNKTQIFKTSLRLPLPVKQAAQNVANQKGQSLNSVFADYIYNGLKSDGAINGGIKGGVSAESDQ